MIETKQAETTLLFLLTVKMERNETEKQGTKC